MAAPIVAAWQNLAFWNRILAGLLIAFAGCERASSPSSPAAGAAAGRIDVVATVGMVADVVRQVGGDRVEVTQIMGPGVDPHLYKPTRDDVQTIMRGDLVFYSGLLLEGKMEDTLTKIARNKPVVAVTDGLQEADLLAPDDFAGHADPHVWMDVALWSQTVETIRQTLAKFDPDHAEAYRQRAAAYRRQLDELDAYGKQVIASIPPARRLLITSHDAFNYLGRAYGLEVRGVQGLSTDSEAGLQQINALVDLIVEKEIAAVFVESSVSRKNIIALIDGAASRGHQVVIGGELFSDAMGPAGSYEGTYAGMLDHNLTTIARELGGDAPASGLRGKLSL